MRCCQHSRRPTPSEIADPHELVRRTVPGATTELIEHATQFVSGARNLDIDKLPGLAETIDWVAALVALGLGRVSRLGGADAGVNDGAGQENAAEVGQGVFVVAGRDAAPLLEPVEAALDGVA